MKNLFYLRVLVREDSFEEAPAYAAYNYNSLGGAVAYRNLSRGRQSFMKIGIIGSGNIGGTTARLFVNAGNQIAISNSKGPQSLESLVASIGADAKAMTVQAPLHSAMLYFLQYHGGREKSYDHYHQSCCADVPVASLNTSYPRSTIIFLISVTNRKLL